MGIIDTARKAAEYDAIEKAANEKKIALANRDAQVYAQEAMLAKEGLAGLLAEREATRAALINAIGVPGINSQGIRG